MITAPIENTDRAILRAVLEATAQFMPVTAALTRLYQTTHPSKFQQDVASWQVAVSDTVNQQDVRLAALEAAHHPQLLLSDEAVAVARWLSETSEFGLEDGIGFGVLVGAFEGMDKADLEDAVAELAAVGLVSSSGALGHAIFRLRPTVLLYALFDPLVLQTSPQSDAAVLAAKALALNSGSVRELLTALEWSVRRLNPALLLLMTQLPGAVSREVSPDLATRFFSMTPDNRFALKRLAARAG
ncbi:hypothetical protein [Brevundimonas sp. FT23042]|uniref:hypothetical protein n=1 Tax=Brevundimonas sp. FT23042 TaxID=3393749 RepID=UPI003B587FA2